MAAVSLVNRVFIGAIDSIAESSGSSFTQHMLYDQRFDHRGCICTCNAVSPEIRAAFSDALVTVTRAP